MFPTFVARNPSRKSGRAPLAPVGGEGLRPEGGAWPPPAAGPALPLVGGDRLPLVVGERLPLIGVVPRREVSQSIVDAPDPSIVRPFREGAGVDRRLDHGPVRRGREPLDLRLRRAAAPAGPRSGSGEPAAD